MIANDFGKHRIVVVGDVMLDRYWEGVTQRISPEAPVPVVRIDHATERPGGAANVALNLAALGVPVTLIGWVGEDVAGATLITHLKELGVDCQLNLATGCRTVVKLRVLSLQQQVVRLDFDEAYPPIDGGTLEQVVDKLDAAADLVIFSDYGKGTLSAVGDLISFCQTFGIRAIVDPKGTDFDRYRGAHVITPNENEFVSVVGVPVDEQDFEERAETLRRKLDLQALLVTRGPRGMSLFHASQGAIHFPAQALDVYDVTGAGDTATATLAAGLGASMPMVEAVRLANRAASMVVSRRGSASITRADLFGDVFSDTYSGEQTLERIAEASRRGELIVMTNGCFDILHLGHVEYLRAAKGLGHRLVVAVNSDASVARLKGPGRPINTLKHRIEMLASLRAVDWVLSFDGSVDETGCHHDTPLDLIRRVRPNILVKGGDYRLEEIVGATEVISAGGEVRILPFIADQSTTGLIARIKERRS